MDSLSAKVFRTYNASITLQNQLYEKDNEILENENVDKKVKFYNDCNREVARLCNHQKAVAKNFEESLLKRKDMLDSKQEKLRQLEAELNNIKKGKPSNDSKLPKTKE